MGPALQVDGWKHKTSGAPPPDVRGQHTQHKAHSAWHKALTQNTAQSTHYTTTSVIPQLPQVCQSSGQRGCGRISQKRLKLLHLKSGDPVNEAIGEQKPWRQCILFQFN